MPIRQKLKSAGLVALSVSVLGLPLPALAGFEWIPSDGGMQGGGLSQPSVVVSPLPPANGSLSPGNSSNNSAPEVISPVVISGSAPADQASSQPPQDNGGEMAVYNGSPGDLTSPHAPATTYGATTTSTTTTSTTTTAPTAPGPGMLGTLSTPAAGDTVHGFAKNVPLVVALRQILPSGYAFSVDPNIDMGTPVSFTGGRPWRETLQGALSPVGLAMREQGQMVSIGHAGDAAAAMQMPASSSNRMAPLSSVAARTGMEPQPLKPLPATMAGPAGGQIVAPLSQSPAEPATGDWSAERGDNLKKVLENWCRRANVEFDWLAEYDYPLQASVSFGGGFEDAVRSLLAGFEGAHPQPVAELHTNPALRQTVLIVQTRGNTNSD